MKNLKMICVVMGSLTLAACLGGGGGGGGSSSGGLVGGPAPTAPAQPTPGVTTTTVPNRYKLLENLRDDLNSMPGSNGLWGIKKAYANGRDNFAVLQGPDGKFYAIDVTKWAKGQTISDMINSGIAVPNLVASSVVKNEYTYQGTNYISRSGFACPSGSSCSTTYPNERKIYKWQNPDQSYSTGEICPHYSCTSETIKGAPFYTWEDRESIYAYEDVTYTYYKDPVSGISFEEGDYTSKDLETLSAQLEDQAIEVVRNNLVSQFGLSESRASELASMAHSVGSVLKNQNRALTERDLQALQVKAMGFTAKDFVSARLAGDKTKLNELAQRAAKLNKISVEHAKRLLNQLAQ